MEGIRTAIGERLRGLYGGSDANYRKCALAGMLASGSDDFKDIIEPILSGDDQQAVLGAYRAWDAFHVSSLGPGWRDTVSGWKEEARVAFVSELLHYRNVPEVTALALADPSIKVKQAAIQGLSWIGAEDDATRFLTSLNQTDFDLIVGQLDPDFIPLALRDRALTVLQNRHAKEADPLARLTTLLRLAELGVPGLVEQLKTDLASITGKIDSNRANYVIKPALDIIRATDASWASDWVADKVADGSLWHESWEK